MQNFNLKATVYFAAFGRMLDVNFSLNSQNYIEDRGGRGEFYLNKT